MTKREHEYRLTRKQWTGYWRQSTITTFNRQFYNNYDKEFYEFWNQIWEKLNRKAKIVDLATGNGAVALLAMNFSEKNNMDFKITGIDYADINPKIDLSEFPYLAIQIAKINFISNTKLENTGLQDCCFDLLTSQYGFEYSDIISATNECNRLLKSGGKVALILHHQKSAIVEQARDSIKLINQLLQLEKLDKKIIELIKYIGNFKTEDERDKLKKDSNAERLRNAVNSSLHRLNLPQNDIKDTYFLDATIPRLMDVFGKLKNSSVNEKIYYLEGIKKDINAFSGRMSDVISASLSKNDLDNIASRFKSLNFKIINIGEIYYNLNDLMAWTLIVEKK